VTRNSSHVTHSYESEWLNFVFVCVHVKDGIGWFGGVFSHSHAKIIAEVYFVLLNVNIKQETALLNTGKNAHSI